ncbi:glycosyltransferase [Rasiella sp. SM2506]|uniref:glycosyltransferase n=1 Tax=Rasiella sp. SM2506 TaxID=3423914 RepID=UPI003D78E05F
MIHSNKHPDISVIIPIFNEEKNIPVLYKRLKDSVRKISENYEFIFINDGSKDLSIFELVKLTEQDSQVRYINFSRNFGHQIAVTAGLNHCNGEAVVIIDGDLQDPPELIPELYTKFKEGYEVVYAKRKKREGESFFKKATAKVFYRVLKKITTIDIPLDTGDFRLIDKKVVHYLRLMPEQNKFIRGQIAWLGFNQTHVLYNRDSRTEGKTGYSISKMFNFAMDGITGFSDKPLSFVTKLGFLISFFSFLAIVVAIYSHFILEKTITGWTSLIIAVLFIGGIQLISIGIIGAYISRMNRNLLKRPLYIIESSNLKKQPHDD